MDTLERDALLSRLKARLGTGDESSDELLKGELEDAQAELLLYLNRDALPEAMSGYVVRLAALFYQRDMQGLDGESAGVKAWSYSEGEQSQSATLLTDGEYRAGVDALLGSLARYRRVKVRGDNEAS